MCTVYSFSIEAERVKVAQDKKWSREKCRENSLMVVYFPGFKRVYRKPGQTAFVGPFCEVYHISLAKYPCNVVVKTKPSLGQQNQRWEEADSVPREFFFKSLIGIDEEHVAATCKDLTKISDIPTKLKSMLTIVLKDSIKLMPVPDPDWLFHEDDVKKKVLEFLHPIGLTLEALELTGVKDDIGFLEFKVEDTTYGPTPPQLSAEKQSYTYGVETDHVDFGEVSGAHIQENHLLGNDDCSFFEFSKKTYSKNHFHMQSFKRTPYCSSTDNCPPTYADQIDQITLKELLKKQELLAGETSQDPAMEVEPKLKTMADSRNVQLEPGTDMKFLSTLVLDSRMMRELAARNNEATGNMEEVEELRKSEEYFQRGPRIDIRFPSKLVLSREPMYKSIVAHNNTVTRPKEELCQQEEFRHQSKLRTCEELREHSESKYGKKKKLELLIERKLKEIEPTIEQEASNILMAEAQAEAIRIKARNTAVLILAAWQEEEKRLKEKLSDLNSNTLVAMKLQALREATTRLEDVLMSRVDPTSSKPPVEWSEDIISIISGAAHMTEWTTGVDLEFFNNYFTFESID